MVTYRGEYFAVLCLQAAHDTHELFIESGVLHDSSAGGESVDHLSKDVSYVNHIDVITKRTSIDVIGGKVEQRRCLLTKTIVPRIFVEEINADLDHGIFDMVAGKFVQRNPVGLDVQRSLDPHNQHKFLTRQTVLLRILGTQYKFS